MQVQYVHQAQEPLPAQLESGQQPATAQQQQQQLLGQQYASACVPMQLQANEPYASLQQQHQLAEQERPEGSQQQQEPEEVEAAEQPTRQRHTVSTAVTIQHSMPSSSIHPGVPGLKLIIGLVYCSDCYPGLHMRSCGFHSNDLTLVL